MSCFIHVLANSQMSWVDNRRARIRLDQSRKEVKLGKAFIIINNQKAVKTDLICILKGLLHSFFSQPDCLLETISLTPCLYYRDSSHTSYSLLYAYEGFPVITTLEGKMCEKTGTPPLHFDHLPTQGPKFLHCS